MCQKNVLLKRILFLACCYLLASSPPPPPPPPPPPMIRVGEINDAASQNVITVATDLIYSNKMADGLRGIHDSFDKPRVFTP